MNKKDKEKRQRDLETKLAERDLVPHEWWPKLVDKKYIPEIRELGKKGVHVQYGEGINVRVWFGNGEPITVSKFCGSVDRVFLVTLAAALADGPKLFHIPPDLIDDLNKIDIPLKVPDFAAPFKSCIVKSRDEYHIVTNVDGTVMCLTIGASGDVDSFVASDPSRTLDSYMNDSTTYLVGNIEDGHNQKCEVDESLDLQAEHPFRATLNYLLLLTAGGFTENVNTKNHRGKNKVIQATIPTTFVPQDISLWRKRVIDANTMGDGTGKKRAHWRRAHWRHVAVGVGRTKRELRLIAATLVNKKHIAGADPADSSYTVKEKAVKA